MSPCSDRVCSNSAPRRTTSVRIRERIHRVAQFCTSRYAVVNILAASTRSLRESDIFRRVGAVLISPPHWGGLLKCCAKHHETCSRWPDKDLDKFAANINLAVLVFDKWDTIVRYYLHPEDLYLAIRANIRTCTFYQIWPDSWHSVRVLNQHNLLRSGSSTKNDTLQCWVNTDLCWHY